MAPSHLQRTGASEIFNEADLASVAVGFQKLWMFFASPSLPETLQSGSVRRRGYGGMQQRVGIARDDDQTAPSVKRPFGRGDVHKKSSDAPG
jgi:hypothetical protein